MKITLYKGYHSQNAYAAFEKSFARDELIVFLPPKLDNYDFVKHLRPGAIELAGELWHGSETLPKPNGPMINASAGVFSSGTSQNPRLVLYSKNNLQSSIQGIFELFDRDLLSDIFCYPQPFHTFGLTLGYAAATILKLHLTFPEGPYSQSHHQFWLDHVQTKTLTLGTPTHFHDLLGFTKDREAIPNSYSCIIGGAKVQRELWLQCQQDLNINSPSIGYGATEASPGVTHLPPGVLPKEDGEIGIPLPHVEAEITASGLSFSGPNLCTAIVDSSGVVQPTTFELPDLVEVRASDQHWIYKARSNWFLNRGGEKFSLESLESILQESVPVETLCLGVPDPRLGEDLAIFYISSGSEQDRIKQQILSCLKEKTNRNFKAEKLFAIDQLPLNSSLKKDRKRAAEMMFRKLNL